MYILELTLNFTKYEQSLASCIQQCNFCCVKSMQIDILYCLTLIGCKSEINKILNMY